MSAPYDLEKGDAVHPGRPVQVDRYTVGARINHWVTAISLILLAISGLIAASDQVVKWLVQFYPSFLHQLSTRGGQDRLPGL